VEITIKRDPRANYHISDGSFDSILVESPAQHGKSVAGFVEGDRRKQGEQQQFEVIVSPGGLESSGKPGNRCSTATAIERDRTAWSSRRTNKAKLQVRF
jgi:hypothetical protein